MKRIKSFLTIIMAAIFALSLVPAGAWAADATPDKGDLENGTTGTPAGVGSITIANPKENETYTVYKIFDLASFDDNDTRTGQHSDDPDQEAYSYVIKSDSGWLNFLTGQGPVGQSYKYARYSDDGSGTATADAREYFVIDRNKVKLKTGTGGAEEEYYVVTPTAKFKNTVDLNHVIDDTGAATARDDDPGTPKGNDYTDNATNSGNTIVQDFAQEALKYAASHTTGTGAVSSVATLTSTSPAYQNAPLGYYLVGTTMGTLASLDTNNKNVNIYEKNDEPELDKKVLKKGGTIPTTVTADYLTGTGATAGDWVECTDADLEDYVQFRTVITAQQGAKDYRLHDVMEKGLEFVSTDVATANTDRYVDNASTPAAVATATAPKVYLVRDETIYEIPASRTIESTDYVNWVLTPKANLNYQDGCDFEIAFKDATSTTTGGVMTDSDDRVVLVQNTGSTLSAASVDVKDGDKIVVLYWARLTKDAQVFDDDETNNTATTVEDNAGVALGQQQYSESNTDKRNTNSTILTYGNKSYTQWRQAAVTTYQLDVVKTNEKDVTNGGKELLAGAEFSLYKATQNDSSGTYNDGAHKWDKGANALVFKKSASGNEYYYAGDKVTMAGTTQDSLETVNKLVSAADHEIHLEGLEDGTYILIEDKAPIGYNKLSQPVFITINGDNSTIAAATYEGTLTFTQTLNDNVTANKNTGTNVPWNASLALTTPESYSKTNPANNGGIQIINQTGTELPSTGGIGTTIFYVAGTVLVVGAGVMLVAKRRMGSEA